MNKKIVRLAEDATGKSERKNFESFANKKLIENSFNSTELTKININYFEAFSDKDDELHHIRKQAHEFMDVNNYDKYVSIKYTHKRQLNALGANTIFSEVYENFKKMLSLTEIFGVITNYFEIDGTEYYNLLSARAQDALKEEVVKSTSYTKRELFCENTEDGFYMPEI